MVDQRMKSGDTHQKKQDRGDSAYTSRRGLSNLSTADIEPALPRALPAEMTAKMSQISAT